MSVSQTRTDGTWTGGRRTATLAHMLAPRERRGGWRRWWGVCVFGGGAAAWVRVRVRVRVTDGGGGQSSEGEQPVID